MTISDDSGHIGTSAIPPDGIGLGRTSRRPRVLVADDEPRFVRGISLNLELSGYEVIIADNGKTAVELVAQAAPDLVLLDIRMPGLDGNEACRRIREISTVPIIMLTALATDRDKVQALDIGADDYITKPFSAEELLARVRAALRRANLGPQRPVESAFRAGDLSIDYLRQRVLVADREVELTSTEYRLLCELVREPGHPLSPTEILDRVWRQGDGAASGTLVWQAIHRLRQKIERDPQRPKYILTRHGVGYYFTKQISG